MAQWLKSRTCNLKVVDSSLRSGRDSKLGSECPVLSPPSIPRLRWDPWARHWTPNCSPGAAALAAHCLCVFYSHCCVCALWWVKCKAQIPCMERHTSFLFHPFAHIQFHSYRVDTERKIAEHLTGKEEGMRLNQLLACLSIKQRKN